MSPRSCLRCGTELQSDDPEEPCPACEVEIAAGSLSELTGAVAAIQSEGDSPGSSGADARLRPGQRFGPFRIHRLLGCGGMGEVYDAEHLWYGRRVALKVLNQRLRRADDRARFLQEGQLAAAVNHPNVVYIFSSDEVDDIPIITMELLPGGTLKDRV